MAFISYTQTAAPRLAGAAGQAAGTILEETADIETSSENYARRFSGAVGTWFLNLQRDATLRMLAPYPRASVLDVGGGHGQLAGPLADGGYRVTVVGSAAGCASRIRGLVQGGRCAFGAANLLSLPYPDRSFDVVTCFRLLPHVTHWRELLAELCRVARVAVVLDYPALNSVNVIAPQLFRFKKRLEGNTRPYTCFDEAQIVEAVQQYGFTRESRFAEYFLPMVLHRRLRSPFVSAALEKPYRILGLTERYGSPVILKLTRSGGRR